MSEPIEWSRDEMDRALSSNKWCRHYAGMYNADTCKAGVRYADVKVGANAPCFKDRCEGTTCASQSFLTDVEAFQAIVSVREAFQSYFDKIKADTCPVCGKPIGKQRQVGPCVYADPCGHRLYKGRVSKGVS